MPRKPKNIAGQRFGRLLVLSLYGSTARGRAQWKCLCDCGTETIVTTYRLTAGTLSCGCLQRERIAKVRERSIQGEVFGKLTAVRRVENDGYRAVWICACECGNEVRVRRHNLTSGGTVSCGCLSANERGVFTTTDRRKLTAAYASARRARQRDAGGTFTPAQIDALLVKQRERCANCGCKLTEKNLARDHRQALANGGSNDILNMELLCRPCNLRKRAKDEIAWANENGRLL